MKLKTTALIIVAGLFLLSTVILMADDTAKKPVKKVDEVTKGNLCEVFIKPTKIKQHFEFEITLVNTLPIAAMSFPFKIMAKEGSMSYDSISFAGTRAEFCAVKIPNPDTTNQMFNLGLLASMTPPMKYIEPGEGTIARVYFTADQISSTKDILLDTTFFPPSNHLVGVLPDAKENLIPAFKVTRVEKK